MHIMVCFYSKFCAGFFEETCAASHVYSTKIDREWDEWSEREVEVREGETEKEIVKEKRR